MKKINISGLIKSSIFHLKTRIYKRFPNLSGVDLPNDAIKYLKRNNPRLIELKNNYLSHKINHSFWENWMDLFNLTSFRGNIIYLSDQRKSKLNYLITAVYVEMEDKLNLLNTLKEDKLFGAVNYEFLDIKISRDLLDSVLQINFIEENLKISEIPDLSVLDIGAGYGRFAHRLVTAMPNVRVYCTDAVPESTFICEYYLSFRNVQDRAITIPFNEIEKFLDNNTIDIATNINSFPECTLEFIEWWLDLLKKYKIKYLIIILPTRCGGSLIPCFGSSPKIPGSFCKRSRGTNSIVC